MANGEVVYRKGVPKEVVKIIAITVSAAIIIGLFLAFFQTPVIQQTSQQSPQPGPQTTPPVVQTPQKTPQETSRPVKTGAIKLDCEELVELEEHSDKLDEMNRRGELVRLSGEITSAAYHGDYYGVFVAVPNKKGEPCTAVEILLNTKFNETKEALMPYVQEYFRARPNLPNYYGEKITVEGKLIYVPGHEYLNLLDAKIYSIGG